MCWRSPRRSADYRRKQAIDGPLFIGIDTHALSAARLRQRARGAGGQRCRDDDRARRRVHADARGVARHPGAQPRPHDGLADGIVITPSHNPPDDGGFKYNPPNGGPADTDVTSWIETQANALLADGLQRRAAHAVRRGAARASTTHEYDFLGSYVADLGNVIDFDAIRAAGIRMGVDPLGGAGVHYWARIAERYGIDLDRGQRPGRSDLRAS